MKESIDMMGVLVRYMGGNFHTLSYTDKLNTLVTESKTNVAVAPYRALLGYLSQFKPSTTPRSMEDQSSADIAESLSTVWSYEVNEVTAMMYLLGYEAVYQGVGCPVWAMAIRESEQ